MWALWRGDPPGADSPDPLCPGPAGDLVARLSGECPCPVSLELSAPCRVFCPGFPVAKARWVRRAVAIPDRAPTANGTTTATRNLPTPPIWKSPPHHHTDFRLPRRLRIALDWTRDPLFPKDAVQLGLADRSAGSDSDSRGDIRSFEGNSSVSRRRRNSKIVCTSRRTNNRSISAPPRTP